MIEFVHTHIIEELKTNTKTDTIFIITAIFLNLLTLAINTTIAASGSNFVKVLILFVFIILVIIINIVVEIGLLKGMQTRTKLINGLLQMYKDKKVDKYYDSSLLLNYKIRYILFMLAVVFIGIVSIIVPFIMLSS